MDLLKKHCMPCEAGTPPLSETEENRLNNYVKWEIDRDGVHKIRTSYTFNDFKESMAFANRVAAVAEEERHHPDLHISYRKVIVEIHTHAILGLSVNDFVLAAKIDKMANLTELEKSRYSTLSTQNG